MPESTLLVEVLESMGGLSRQVLEEEEGPDAMAESGQENWRLSPLGENAARLRGANGLLLALALAPGTDREAPADHLTEGAFAGFAAALVTAESIGGRMASSNLPPSEEVLLALEAFEPTLEALQEAQGAQGVTSATEIDLRMVGAVEAWAAGVEFKELMSACGGLDEGDLARVLRRVRELLLQLPSLPFIPKEIVQKARSAADAMDRAPISNMVE